MESILKIFNPKDEQELKKAIKDVIIKQIKIDMREQDEYIFNSEELEEMIKDSFQEIIEELKGEFRPILRAKMEAALSKLIPN